MYDKDLDRVGLEAEFLAIVSEIVPGVCQDLSAVSLNLYKQIAAPPMTWEDLQLGIYRPEKEALRKSLEAWADHWKLTAEWCKEAAYCTLRAWALSGKFTTLLHPGLTKMMESHPPPNGLPLYRQELGRPAYLGEIKEAALQLFLSNALLKHGDASHRESFIASIVTSKSVQEYCEQVERLEGVIKSQSQRRKPNEHLRWAVRFYVKGDKQVDIVNEIYDAGNEITPPAVSDAIKSILKDLQLRS